MSAGLWTASAVVLIDATTPTRWKCMTNQVSAVSNRAHATAQHTDYLELIFTSWLPEI